MSDQALPAFDDNVATTEAALLGTASAITGYTDFGDEAEYLPGLRRLIQAIATEVPMTPMGRQFAFGVLLGPLMSRLYACEGCKRRPDCLTRPVKAPVIILGLPRTGTTALHHLLSLDPQFQAPEMWLIESPMPRPPRATWANNPAHQRSVAGIEALLEAAPDFAVAHPRDADLVDEGLDIVKACYVSNAWGTYFPVPSYDDWWPQQDHGPQYCYLRRVLQLIAADDQRRWLLKDPTSIMHLPTLRATFPDALLIVTHRDPAEVVPSVSSLVRSFQSLVMGDGLDVQRLAARELEFWSRGANLLAQAPDSGRRIDIHMRKFQANPMRTVRDVYDRLGLTLSVEAEQAMRSQLTKAQTASTPPHRYTLEEFGLDAKRIHKKFFPYIERFNVLG